MQSEARKKAKLKYDNANMAYQTVKVKKTTLEEFRRIVQDNGDKVNTVLRSAIEDYITAHTPPAPPAPPAPAPPDQPED